MSKAQEFAIQKHNDAGCLYDGYPYELHLKLVVAVAEKFTYLVEPDIGFTLDACWLHDTLEDVPGLTYNDLQKEFGVFTANIVYAVTNELGKNRKERAAKTYPKIRENPYAIFVKLCDRIANLEYSIFTGSTMAKKYMEEMKEFESQLYTEQYDPMWRYLTAVSDLMVIA